MSVRSRAVVGGALLAIAAAPAAEARVPADAAAHVKRAKLRLAGLGPVPSTVPAGRAVRVTGRVVNLPRRLPETARLTFSLRRSPNARRGRHLRGANLKRTRAGRSRTFSVRVRVPRGVRPGRYHLRACVRRGSGELRGSCRSRRLQVTATGLGTPTPGTGTPAPPPATHAPGATQPAPSEAPSTTTPPPPAGPAPEPASGAAHSLRAPVTGENFYFVMADRFQNGDPGNDRGGIAGDDPDEHGFDPTRKGYYHGGDLKGLLDEIDYIQGLGTTSIWLTPSFKNRPVQGPEGNRSAGYHGYWVTDFTQIDPHLGTNEDLRNVVEAAHGRGMKVYFDIITNHTADVIAHEEDRYGYVPKDVEPYRTAAGAPFDDRDFAGGSTFPALDPATSFPYTPMFTRPGDESIKRPEWLNDTTLYHMRGDTTFVGEDSLYGDFFGLDDLFTEHPRVVDGMIDVYKAWIRDYRIDGFRIDTMKHVDDEFWQRFAPAVLDYARGLGKTEFFMFGEVFDVTKSFTSHFTTHDQVQSVLDFPFQEAARDFASRSRPTDGLRTFFQGDDWYTDADSNAYQLPTFLGNHDMGHVGMFLRDDNAGAPEPELLERDVLAHQLMYLSRGNPVVYFGDEQGFTGAGNDQAARQDMFPSRDPEYDNAGDDAGKNDNIGSTETPMDDNFDRDHPLYREIATLARLAEDEPALRNGAQQHRYSSSGAGIYAFSRLARVEQREYVVALNNAEQPRIADVPTYMATGVFTKVYGDGPPVLGTDAGKRLQVTLPPLSAVVYRAEARIPQSGEAPSVAVFEPPHDGEGRDRMEVRADVGGDSFYEVTFHARVADGDWHTIGTDDNAPYRVFHDVRDLDPGTRVEYQAVVLDNAGHSRRSAVRTARVAQPAIRIETPAEGASVRGSTEVRAVTEPEHSHYTVTFQRRIGSGDWTDVGTDESSPVYTVYDDPGTLATGTQVSYRAILDYGAGTVTSAERNLTAAPPPVTTAVVHYNRPAGDYADWGLHLWGDAIADGVETTWAAPRQRNGVDAYGAFFDIPLEDDTQPVNFIVHRPGGDSVPATREPGGDRSFVPADHAEIWLRQGDPVVYTSEPVP